MVRSQYQVSGGSDVTALVEEIEQTGDRLAAAIEALAYKKAHLKDEVLEIAEEKADQFLEKAEETKDQLVAKISAKIPDRRELKAMASKAVAKIGDSAGEAKDTVVEKAAEAKDTVLEKAAEAKDTVLEKAAEAKETVVGKAAEAKDAVVGKAAEAKDAVVEKAAEAKDAAVEKTMEAEHRIAAVAAERLPEATQAASDIAEKVVDTVSRAGESAVTRLRHRRIPL